MTTRRNRVRAVRYGTSRRQLVALALLAAVLSMVPMLGKVAHAQTTADVLPLTLTVSALTPTAPQPGDLLEVGGVLTNPTAVEYDNLSIALRISQSPLVSRSQLLAVASSTIHFPSLPAGDAQSVSSIAAGASLPFTFQVPVDSLDLVTPGVYRLAVEVSDSDSSDPYDARVNTFLPWLPPSAGIQPLHVAWVWPMLTTPRLLPDGSFSNDGLGPEIGPVGRLGRLLQVANQALAQSGTVAEAIAPVVGTSTDPAPTPVTIRPVPVTPVVDPETVEELQLMAGSTPYQVNGSPGAFHDAAVSYLASLNTLMGKTSSIATPYADPDIQALTDAHASSLVTQARSTGLEAGLAGVVSGLIWPPDGTLSEGALDQLTTTGLVLSNSALPITDAAGLSYTPTATTAVDRPGGSVPAVVVDDGLSRLVTKPVAATDRVLLAQRYAAETAAIAVESAPADRTLVLAPGRRWSPTESSVRALLDETGRLPWLAPEAVSAALQAPTDPAVTRAPLAEPAGAASLPPGAAARIAGVSDELAGYRSILCPPIVAPAGAKTSTTPTTKPAPTTALRCADATPLVLPLQRAIYRAASTAFRKPDSGGEALLTATQTELRADEDKIKITTRGDTELVGNRAKIPISIVNTSTTPVKVQLILISRSAGLSTSKAVSVFLPAGGNIQQNVGVSIRRAGGGVLSVDAQLMTPLNRNFGPPVHLKVKVSAYGAVIVTITVAVCGLLGLAVIVRIYRRIRNARRGISSTPDVPADATA